MVKNLPAMQEARVRFLGQEDPLEKGTAIHSSIGAWRIPRKEKPGGLQFVGSQRIEHLWMTNNTVRPETERLFEWMSEWSKDMQMNAFMSFSQQAAEAKTEQNAKLL